MAVFYKNVDLKLNQLQNVKIDNVNEVPAFDAAEESRVIYDLQTNALYYNNGTDWVKWMDAGDAIDFAQGNGITLNETGSPVTELEIAVNAETGSGLGFDGNGQLQFVPSEVALSDIGAPTADVDLSGQRITDLGTPIDGTDAANKDYVDAAVSTGGTTITEGAGISVSETNSPTGPEDYTIAVNLNTVDNSGNNGLTLVPNGLSVNAGDYIVVNGNGVSVDTSNLRLNNLAAATDNYDMGGFTITGLAAPTDNSDAATKGYVDDLITGLSVFQGSWDFGQSPADEYPELRQMGDTNIDIQPGDYWRITSASTLGVGTANIIAQPGDVLFYSGLGDTSPNIDYQDPNNWFLVQSNVDQATESILGLVRLASEAEVLAGTNTEKVVTPATLQAKINNVNAGQANVYRETVTAVSITSATPFTVTHNLGLLTPFTATIQIYENGDQIFADISNLATNSFSLTFTPAPTVDIHIVVVG